MFYDLDKVFVYYQDLKTKLSKNLPEQNYDTLPKLLIKVFPKEVLVRLLYLKQVIQEIPKPELNLFLIALLRILQRYSLAIPTGGWLKWVEKEINAGEIFDDYMHSLNLIISDYQLWGTENKGEWQALRCDSRKININDHLFDAVITSPPYANRHDYSRVFNIELLFAFLDEDELKDFRYQRLTSHVESKPYNEWRDHKLPRSLHSYLKNLKSMQHDHRIPPMLTNYFLDLKETLLELRKILNPGAKLAFVLGNVCYSGLILQVDKIFGEIAQMMGYNLEEIIALRYRGNSAQQMRKFGKKQSRESVVILTY